MNIRLILLLAACNSNPGVQCATPFAACGGDVTGTWKVASSCFTPSTSTCPTLDLPSLQLSGTYTFGADGMYSVTITESGTATFHLAASCSNAPANCQGMSASNATYDLQCSGDASAGCDCTQTFTGAPSSFGPVAYSVSSAGIMVQGGTIPYCVRGTTLTIPFIGAAGASIGTLTLERQ